MSGGRKTGNEENKKSGAMEVKKTGFNPASTINRRVSPGGETKYRDSNKGKELKERGGWDKGDINVEMRKPTKPGIQAPMLKKKGGLAAEKTVTVTPSGVQKKGRQPLTLTTGAPNPRK